MLKDNSKPNTSNNEIQTGDYKGSPEFYHECTHIQIEECSPESLGMGYPCDWENW